MDSFDEEWEAHLHHRFHQHDVSIDVLDKVQVGEGIYNVGIVQHAFHLSDTLSVQATGAHSSSIEGEEDNVRSGHNKEWIEADAFGSPTSLKGQTTLEVCDRGKQIPNFDGPHNQNEESNPWFDAVKGFINDNDVRGIAQKFGFL